MKPAFISPLRLITAIVIVAITIGLVSWGYHQTPGNFEQVKTDTIPQKENQKKTKNLDEIFENDENINTNINWEKMQQELTDALKNIDVDKIKIEIEKAMKEVDMAKIQQEVQASLAKIDFDKIKIEVANALKEVDFSKIQAEAKESLAKIDWDKMRIEIEKVKDIDMKKIEKELEKVQEELKELQPKLEKELEKAKVEIEKAKLTIKEYKEFTEGLENDGLLDKKQGYTLKHKDGELFINGKKASQETYNKYLNFLNKHNKFSIDTNGNDFKMNND